MTTIWQREARNHLYDIIAYIRLEHPIAAHKVYMQIIQNVQLLSRFPNIGRKGRVRNTREFIVRGYPYIIVYYIEVQELYIMAIYHTSRKWPENFSP